MTTPLPDPELSTQQPLGVITVTYSPGRHLRAFLGSLPTKVQIILADNGSTDGVPEAAAEAAENVTFLPTGGNIGYGSAINLAARYLREKGQVDSEFFLVSNPDVVFSPGAIEELIACARRHPEAGAVGPLIREADGSIYPSARNLPNLKNGIGHALLGAVWKNNPFSKAYLAEHDMDSEHSCGWLSGSCLLLRWEAFEKIGGFDERYFMYMEDVDLGDRLGRAGYSNIYCPSAEISHDKGHSAGKHPEVVLPAHHASAYRYQADRLSGWYLAPVRAALWAGLKVRSLIAVSCAQRRTKKEED